MKKLLAAGVAAVTMVLSTVIATGAMAAPVSPFDGPATLGAPVAGQALPTGLFSLGFDLTTVGVDSAELATAGPQASASSSSSGGMLIVDNDLLDCPNADHTSIQAAVTAATPGAKIKVCRGTYIEQVIIPAGKDDLTLFSEGHLQAVIKAPAVMVDEKAIVRVAGAQGIVIRHFTITGPGGGGCDSIRWGVRVDSGGSAEVTHNHITKIRDTGLSGCQNGIGVLVGRNFQNTTGFATVSHNLIDDYQKGGIVVDGLASGPASTAEVDHNLVVGIGPTPSIAQNGIQISRGAAADVHHNVVHGNVYSLPPFFGEGILLFQSTSPNVTIHHNDVYENADGIGLYTTTDSDVSYNRSHDNGPYDGLFADSDTADNVFAHNKLFDNAEWDCADFSFGPGTAGTANFWIQDLGYTENRPGLCKHATVTP